MAQIVNQSEESKAIKRYNEQLSEIGKLSEDVSSNTLVTPWSRAIRESGLDFTRKDIKDKSGNVVGSKYVIRNTRKNQQKLAALEKNLKKYKAKTVGQFKADIKAELKKEAEQQAKQQYPGKGKKAQRAREKYVRQQLTRAKQRERTERVIHQVELSEQLDLVYELSPALGERYGRALRRLTKGKHRGDIDQAQLYDFMGRISAQTERLQAGLLTEREQERILAKQQIEGDYAYSTDGEVSVSGRVAKYRSAETPKQPRKNRSRKK